MRSDAETVTRPMDTANTKPASPPSQAAPDSAVRTRLLAGTPPGTPTLIGFTPWGHLQDYDLPDKAIIGRLGGGYADIELPSQVVSARHGEVGIAGGACFYRDLDSSNGTLLNGQPCRGTARLHDGDALGFAPGGNPASIAVKLVFAYTKSGTLNWRKIPVDANVQEIIIGRSGGIAIQDEYLSRQHASFFQSSKGMAVVDLASTNGIQVNGMQVEGTRLLEPMDVVRIGSSWALFLPGELWIGSDEPIMDAFSGQKATRQPADSPAPSAVPLREDTARADADSTNAGLVIDIREKNVWSRVKSKTLLKDVHLAVNPGDFVLVLGGSGAGKTTFLNAVMGYDKAEGSVTYGDVNVYREYERIKYQIGYVPQQDLLRFNDTVDATLLASARMRMPSDTSRGDRRKRAEWASSLLGLSREGTTLVGRLSGGQRKRLSIAVELVGDPALFFLDEPDSGLDGIMARSLMENLKDIADLGKMVLVITHGPDRAADLFTQVLVLAKSELDGAGHMVFFGPVQQAMRHFGVDTLEGIVRKINREDEGGEGLADYYLNLWEGR